ncbi:transcriptional repressor [Macrococcus hajekii]|uniref:Ferric uptake regulation protein n=1 Tax=Macrococcus hajekii TaxID=198482 RepID=A0A4R6BMF0_9STAP|nr:Fur family transcriptional regulator [Macrococcus hajekii]TDM02898.1 transcriptional repressor [Macrococcus hajekii]GGB04744.1 ferric uptake regulation protein [Macrococcus hajekii]
MKIEEAIQTLKNNGYKYTDKRRDMITILAEEDKYITAKAIQFKMYEMYPGISFDTVYRNLHLFSELNIIEATEWNNEKQFRLSCAHHHHHHFICESCGQTKVIEHCPLEVFKNELPGVEIKNHKIELYGLCEKCQ